MAFDINTAHPEHDDWEQMQHYQVHLPPMEQWMAAEAAANPAVSRRDMLDAQLSQCPEVT